MFTSATSIFSAGSSFRWVRDQCLAGGTSLDDSINVRGAYIGLDLGHTQADIIHAAMEGIAMGMRLALDALLKLTKISDEMVVVGGGSRLRSCGHSRCGCWVLE